MIRALISSGQRRYPFARIFTPWSRKNSTVVTIAKLQPDLHQARILSFGDQGEGGRQDALAVIAGIGSGLGLSLTQLQMQLHAVDPPALPATAERGKVDDFYTARSSIWPPLSWTDFAPPFSAGYGLCLRRQVCLAETSLNMSIMTQLAVRGENAGRAELSRQYIRAPGLTGLKEVAEQSGHDLAKAFGHFGLTPSILRQADVQIDFAIYCNLLEHCAASWKMPDLAFRLAPYQHLEILGPVALVTRMERNLNDALNAILHNLVVYTNVLIVALEKHQDVAALILSTQGSADPRRQYILLALAVTKNIVEQAAGQPIGFIEASFREAEDGAASVAQHWFGCPVRFGAERNALYFDRAALELPLERADTAYHAIIRRYLSTERETAAGSTADLARAEIARQMELGQCELEIVAQGLRTEPRSLQRRLKVEGTSFRELVDEWRRERAMSLVTMTRVPLSDVADALGYAHQAVFTRAFQRWYGQAPLACRQQAGETPTN